MEVIFCLLMMNRGFLAPTLNLEDVDPRCAGLQHATRVVRANPVTVMTGNFAFGGIGATLILRKA
jgi:3-oxoacyl-[acyl-carrier-protein] synthase II